MLSLISEIAGELKKLYHSIASDVSCANITMHINYRTNNLTVVLNNVPIEYGEKYVDQFNKFKESGHNVTVMKYSNNEFADIIVDIIPV